MGYSSVPSIVQAMAAIPQTIVSLRTLLSNERPDAEAALQRVEELQQALVTFEGMSGWLEEAKFLHEALQSLDEALEPIRVQYSQATMDSGRFNVQKYNMQDILQAWRAARNHTLSRLLAFLHDIRRIEEQPLVIDTTSRTYVSGPEWAYRFVEFEEQIDSAFTQYDQGDISAITQVASLLDTLDRHVKNHMHLIDVRIRREAMEFARAIAALTGSLKSV